jgi:phosphoserine phosphatase
MAHDVARRLVLLGALALGAAPSVSRSAQSPADELPSWRAGPARRAIETFVARATTPGPAFAPPEERIATFDNDGTLWCEQPMYFEGVFAMDRARELMAKDPSLKSKPLFKAIADNDMAALAALGEKGIAELVGATHAGMTTDDFQPIVQAWFAKATHPRFKRRYSDLVYRPQLELLAYLRRRGFKTWIVSGGGVDFMRAFAAKAYGVPPEQTIGSSGKTKFEMRGGKAVLLKTAALGSIDDHAGKPENIELQIGRRPLIAVGNSDGDLEMLQYSASSTRPSLQLLVHHDDAAREYAYDRKSKIGTLDKAWDEARARGWTVISMKDDWSAIFPS